MPDIIHIAAEDFPSELRPFLRDNNILEIACRRADGAYTTFKNVVLNNTNNTVSSAVQEQIMGEGINPAMSMFNDNAFIDRHMIANIKKGMQQADFKLDNLIQLNTQNGLALQQISANVVNLQKMMNAVNTATWIGNGLTLVNIGFTVAGFVIISRKLSNISAEIENLSEQLQKVDEKINDFAIDTVYRRILYDTTMCLHHESSHEPLDREHIEKLLEDYHLFTETILRQDHKRLLPIETVCYLLYSVLPLYTSVLIIYLEKWYGSYVNRENPLCQTFFEAINKINDVDFRNMMMDHYYIDKGYHNKDVEALLNQSFLLNCNMYLQVQDTLSLLEKTGGKEEYRKVKELINEIAYKKAQLTMKSLKLSLVTEMSEKDVQELFKKSLIESLGQKYGVQVEACI